MIASHPCQPVRRIDILRRRDNIYPLRSLPHLLVERPNGQARAVSVLPCERVCAPKCPFRHSWEGEQQTCDDVSIKLRHAGPT